MGSPDKKLKHPLLDTIAALILMLLGYALSWIDKVHFDNIGKGIGYKWLLILLLLTFLAFLYFLISNRLLLKTNRSKKPKLKLIYGLFWDKKGNPYCPICKTPLSNRTLYICKCSKCEKDFTATGSGGGSISVQNIKNRIDKLWEE